jgi:hypothetical protein
MKTKRINLGVVNLGGMAMISDPCYGMQTWCNSLVLDVLKGKYNAFVRIGKYAEWGERVTELTLCHESRKPFTEIERLEHFSSRIGVDSGTCGIFDKDYYEEHHSKTSNDIDEDWYEKFVCDEMKDYITTDGKGAISSSGCGDGRYPVFAEYKGNKAFAIRIKFL